MNGMDIEMIDIAVNWTTDVHLKFVGKYDIYAIKNMT